MARLSLWSLRKLLIVEWTPVTEIELIPPLGDELKMHLEGYYGAVRHASYSAWNLLYKTLIDNNLPVSAVSFTKTGKPYFMDSTIHFSLSHSHGLCAVAVADLPVGVDIELCMKSYKHHLIERSLCAAEKKVFDGDFTRIWCLKEALAKMTGKGIIGYPRNIDTTKIRSCLKKRFLFDSCNYWLCAVNQESIIGA